MGGSGGAGAVAEGTNGAAAGRLTGARNGGHTSYLGGQRGQIGQTVKVERRSWGCVGYGGVSSMDACSV